MARTGLAGQSEETIQPHVARRIEAGTAKSTPAILSPRLVEHAGALACCRATVVGVGTVSTRCAIGLFMAGDDDPMFFRIAAPPPNPESHHATSVQAMNAS